MTATPQVAVPLELTDFSGGLNLKAAPGELAITETPDAMNITLDERGGIAKRLGYTKDGSMSAFAADGVNLFHSQVLGQLVVQAGTVVKRRTGVGTFSDIKTFTTAARVTFAEFNDKLLMLHPVDGLFSFTSGLSLATISTTVLGVDIAVFQNRVFVAVGSATPANRTRIRFCALGDETTWTGGTSGSNDLREVDDAALTALSSSSRGGLVAFKAQSAYRIHDPSTAAYTTIDPDTGCGGALAYAGWEGLLAVFNESGIYVTDGLSPLELASGRLQPLFTPAQLNLAGIDSACAVATPEGRFLFSFKRAGSSTNNLTLEYDPQAGWIMPHSFGASGFAVHLASDSSLYHLDPGSARFLYKTFDGGSDNGAAIASYFQTPWLHPVPGGRARIQNVSFFGRGDVSVFLRRNHELSGGKRFDLHLMSESAAGVWNTFVWGTGVWGPSFYEFHDIIWPRLAVNAVAFRFEETSTLTGSRPALLGGVSPVVGAFGIYSIQAECQPLGIHLHH